MSEKLKALIPLHDKVLVKRTESDKASPGGILLPDQTREKERPRSGVVMAVGPGKRNEFGDRAPMDVQVGDEVVFTAYAGHDVKHLNEQYLILGQDEIIAKVADADEQPADAE